MLPLHKRLSYQQARSVMLIALALGMLFSFLQIYLDYFSAQAELDNTVKQVVNTVKKSAIQAVDNEDNKLAESLAQGLFQYQPIYKIELFDSRREYLIKRERPLLPTHWRWFSELLFGSNTVYDSPLYLSDTNNFGLLRVTVDNHLLATHFFDRAFITLISGVIRNIILALILLFLFNRLLTNPLLNMVAALRQIDPKQPEKQRLICPLHHEQDELGQLTHSTNQLLNTIEDKLKERDRLLQEMEQAKQLVEHASQAKSEFLATMSHELRTPLNAVLGMLSLTLHTALDDTQNEYVEIANRSGHELLEMINDILDFAMLEAGQLVLTEETFYLHQTIEKLLSEFALSAQTKGLEVLVWIDTDIPERLEGEHARFCQVLHNLISNAIKFTEKGEIIITIRRAATPSAMETTKLYLHCEVSDTGVGIPLEHQAKIFDVFSQIDNSSTRRHEGTGLGLALSKRLVTCMQGQMGLVSTPQVGSCFWFTIGFTANTHTEQYAPFEHLHLLIAHPSVTICQYLQDYVSQFNIQTMTTTHYLELLDKQTEADMLLLDSCLLPSRILSGFTKPNIVLVPCNHLTILEYPHFLQKPIYLHQLYKKIQCIMQGNLSVKIDNTQVNNAPSADTKNILLIEDDIFNQKIALRMLKKLGLHPVIVNTDEEAICLLKQQQYALIFINCHPNLLMHQPLLDTLHHTIQTVPVVALLAITDTIPPEFPPIIQAYIRKPFKLEEFTTLVQRLLNTETV
ncbi:ATP-binding protein [Beggiatoa leptomitoformis]|nr:ATP-binding protein [Beggiatoa leptomitoformis]